jgi:hypothetical protein
MLHFALLVLLASSSSAQERPYAVPEPKGWTTESIDLPPKGFAPDMTWTGKEEIRFAPGMFKPDAPDFFSYAFLFWLPAGQKTDRKTVEAELLTYYRGLSRAVMTGKKKDVDVTGFTLALNEGKPGKRAGGEAVAAYTGELKWVEPFATGKPQALRFEIQVWHNEKHKHDCVFVCVSPRPETDGVWKTLRAVRDGTAFR